MHDEIAPLSYYYRIPIYNTHPAKQKAWGCNFIVYALEKSATLKSVIIFGHTEQYLLVILN